ncbi:hypothetical protein [Aureispira anguillae]|uniref:Uncharacterized protein n=1 Tax=Aureispira anguillae TaxID=2864201 RepID=A0A916DW87_9BACT|nr:hypothetical protein [Aureispira anguillae]BDS14395.1 hypothetical protein AsAng_0051740 [Aureispira anguillae]
MIPSLLQYILFRAKQFLRVLKDIGIGHLIILFPLLAIAVLGVLQLILTSQGGLIAAVLLFTVGGNHWIRKDRFFLEQLSIPLTIFFLLEYYIICSPFLIGFIYWSKWTNLIVLSLGILILSIIKPPYARESEKKITDLFPLQWIPLELFEWRCGFRKNPLGFILLYIVGLIFSYYPITVPVVLLLMGLGIANFFQFYENKDLLLAINNDQKLLQKKTLKSLKLFNLLLIPHYLLFLCFHHGYQYWAALFIVSIIAQMMLIFAIAMKYKTYSFHSQKVHNSIPFAIFVGCLTVPFLWPIPVLMLIHFWKKAQENLIHHYA